MTNVICTFGPHDRVSEEEHQAQTIAVVLQGSFEYRSRSGSGLMLPGSLLLGNARQGFECSHAHAMGDHCIAVTYDDAFFTDTLRGESFRAARIPPGVGMLDFTRHEITGGGDWQEFVISLAGQVAALSEGNHQQTADAATIRRVARTVHQIEAQPGTALSIEDMAATVRVSPFHFLRAFKAATGVTPHQFILRTRLHNAARQLLTTDSPVLEIALASGFGDVSHFNRQFRREFAVSPTAYRRR